MEQPKETERQTEILSPLLLDHADAPTIDPPVNTTSNIPVRITRRNNTRLASNRRMNPINQRRCINISNLQYVSQCPIGNNYPVFKSSTAYLPNFLSTNIRSLFPKMDEFALLSDHLCIDIALRLGFMKE